MKKAIKFLYKYYFMIMAAATALAIITFTVLPAPLDLIKALIMNPVLMVLLIVVLMIWGVTLLITSVIMVVSENMRNSIFLTFSNTEIHDELEEKAVADAIKRAFIFNIAMLSFVFSVSGFSYRYIAADDGEKSLSISYGLITKRYEKPDIKAIDKMIEGMDPDLHAEFKKYGITLKANIDEQDEADDTSTYLIPNEVFSPLGLLYLLLIQFISFRFFLFLNRRALA